MKRLIVINGTMGVGKTATCKELNKRLNNSVWLDGDWCWMMDPFIVNEENKKMVKENIIFLLNNFMNNSNIENIIFNWVIHDESIMEEILLGLKNRGYDLEKITLICSKSALKARISKDIDEGKRDIACLERSVNYLDLYKDMNTEKFDTSEKNVDEVVEEICTYLIRQ
ncbi:AAA family ATPase [Clostridium sardiniense]|uniref:AAA family ATPase n=1 Tax=Clostridium sardiniense TaxID=29369 RepID=UPI00195A7B86|nr:AAA family ATPase [Clostridium sardiniense]MBM7834560.1 broad-specificity NMP kinase [Clostridium sardiniense]